MGEVDTRHMFSLSDTAEWRVATHEVGEKPSVLLVDPSRDFARVSPFGAR